MSDDARPTRREFLHAGAAAAAAAGLPAAAPAGPAPKPTADACILLMLTGGPSQLDTWDPKPSAPSDVRGPFRAIPTRVPGAHLTELFPRMAGMADKFALVRSVHHTAAPVHETGFQLVNTGRAFGAGPEWPSVGAVVAYLTGDRWSRIPGSPVPAEDRLNTGVSVGHGQGAGSLGPGYLPIVQQTEPDRSFETHCRLARFTVAGGLARVAVVNMYRTVFDAVSWDCHADRGSLATDLGDYRDTVAPAFDLAFTALLTDLEQRGLLDRTLVVATGEFGRTPRPNANGGRDHWPGCWTAILAGGGVQGGRVVGRSDAHAAEPADRPVTPAELVATIYTALGIPPATLIPGPDGKPARVVEADPIRELFR